MKKTMKEKVEAKLNRSHEVSNTNLEHIHHGILGIFAKFRWGIKPKVFWWFQGIIIH